MPVTQSKIEWLGVLIMALFMAIYFQVAWQYPVVDSFPLIERLLNPDFLVNDFYTNTLMAYSPRRNTAEILVLLAQWLDMNHYQMIAWVNIFRIVFYALGLSFLLYGMCSLPNVAFIAFYLGALSFLSVPNLPAWWPVTYDLTASSIAGMFAIWAWGFAIRKQVLLTFLLLTPAVYFHPLVGVHSVIIALVLFMARWGFSGILSALKQPGAYIGGLLFLATFLWVYLPYEKSVSNEDFIQINALFKHSHHFFSAKIDSEKWIGFGVYLVGFLYMLWCIKRTRDCETIDIHETKDFYTIPILGYTLFWLIVNVIFVDWYPTRTTVSLIPLRAFPILVPVFLLVYAKYLEYQLANGHYILFFALHLPFLPYQSVGLTWFVFPDDHPLTLPVTIFFVVLLLTMVCDKWGNLFKLIDERLDTLFRYHSLSVIMLPAFIVALLFALYRFQINIPTFDNQPPIYQWIYQNTPQDAVIVSELQAANNQNLRLLARRAIVVSKDFPFAEKFYHQWYERYQDVYEYQPISRGRIDQRSVEELAAIAKKYQAYYLIRTQALADNNHFQLLDKVQGEKGLAYIYRLNHHNLELP